jgi:hypothetical protein
LKSPVTRTPRAFGAQTANDGPGDLADLADVRAEHPPQFLVPALADQVQVELAERGQVAVRVIELPSRPGDPSSARGTGDPVVRHLLVGSVTANTPWCRCVHGKPAAVVEHERHRPGQRAQRPDDDAVRSRVRAEHGVRVVVVSGDDPLDLAQGDFSIGHVYIRR